jgi:hypothetical protein
MGAFDMLKNKRLDMTISVAVFDFKTVLRTGQTGCQGTRQKSKFLPLTEPRDNFLSSAQII